MNYPKHAAPDYLSPQDASQAMHPRVAPQPPLLQKGGVRERRLRRRRAVTLRAIGVVVLVTSVVLAYLAGEIVTTRQYAADVHTAAARDEAIGCVGR
jgi:hypothetical protein